MWSRTHFGGGYCEIIVLVIRILIGEQAGCAIDEIDVGAPRGIFGALRNSLLLWVLRVRTCWVRHQARRSLVREIA